MASQATGSIGQMAASSVGQGQAGISQNRGGGSVGGGYMMAGGNMGGICRPNPRRTRNLRRFRNKFQWLRMGSGELSVRSQCTRHLREFGNQSQRQLRDGTERLWNGGNLAARSPVCRAFTAAVAKQAASVPVALQDFLAWAAGWVLAVESGWSNPSVPGMYGSGSPGFGQGGVSGGFGWDKVVMGWVPAVAIWRPNPGVPGIYGSGGQTSGFGFLDLPA